MIIPNKKITGVFFAKKQILKFEKRYDYVSDEEILNLLLGFVRLIKKSTEVRLEEKYLKEISLLKNEISRLKNI